MYRPLFLFAALCSTTLMASTFDDDGPAVQAFDPFASGDLSVLVRVEADAFDPFDLELQAVDPIVFPEQELTLLDVFDELHRRGLGTTSLV